MSLIQIVYFVHQDPIQFLCNNSIAFFKCAQLLCVKLIITVIRKPSIKTAKVAAK